MIVEKITKFLEAKDRGEIDPAVLAWAIDRHRYALVRQFGTERAEKPGALYATMLTSQCARKAAYTYFGIPKDEPLSARAKMNFYVGDAVEIATLAIAKMAGCDIRTPFEVLPKGEKMAVTRDGITVSAWPDGLATAEDGATLMNLEIKKMNDHLYNDLVKTQQLSDDWGYRSQTALEVDAWRQRGFAVKGTLMVAVKGMTGNYAEVFVPYDGALVDHVFDRARAVLASAALPATGERTLPPRGFALVDEVKSKKATGRLRLGTVCSYCAWKMSCWQNRLHVEVVKGRPVFYWVPAGQEALSSPVEVRS